MEAPVINPLQVVRGLMVEHSHRTPHILLKLTRENILNMCANEANEKRFLCWLRQDVFNCLKEPIKEKFATVDKKVKEPPLGLMPEWLWKEARIAELKQAIKRKVNDKQAGTVYFDYIIECLCDETLMTWVKEYSKLQKEVDLMRDGGS